MAAYCCSPPIGDVLNLVAEESQPLSPFEYSQHSLHPPLPIVSCSYPNLTAKERDCPDASQYFLFKTATFHDNRTASLPYFQL